MKINDNGVTRDMTAEEVAEWEAMAANAPTEEPTPTAEDRLAALEEAMLELAEVIAGG